MVQYTRRTSRPLAVFIVLVVLFFWTSIRRASVSDVQLERVPESRVSDIEFWVERYLQWHYKNRDTAKRGAIFLPVPAGLGDNIKGMINLWGYAVLTNRLFLLDVTTPYPLKEVLSERAIRHFVFDPETDKRFVRRVGDKIRISVKLPLWDHVKKLLRESHPTVALHMSISDRPDTIARDLGFSKTPVPAFSRRVQRAIARIILEPSDEVKSVIHRYKARWKLDASTPYVAVHARLGGVGEQAIKRFARIQGKSEKIAQCTATRILALAKKKGLGAPLHIFVATDTAKFRAYFETSVRKESPSSFVHYMESDVHHYADVSNRSAHVNLHAENLLLGGAEHIIAFRSGFSQVATLRGHADMLVIPYYACGV